jgi:DNA-binding XRE family transcriptional regulator
MQPDPDRLKRLRQERALSQEALAANCGLSRKTLQRMETGADVRPETLAFVAAALGVAVTDFSAPSDGRTPRDDAAENQLPLRRICSGKHVLNQLALTDVGRVECDVDADGDNIELLTALIGRLQGLVRPGWDVPRPDAADLPLLDRLRMTAALNDELHALGAQGISLYMGHYYRFPMTAQASARTAEAERKPIVLTRIYIARSDRERMQVRIDQEWAGAPEGLAQPGDLSDLLAPTGEAMVFLYPTPPARRIDETPPGYVDGVFDVVQSAEG